MARPIIALLTDFGTRDPFVGVMKAVVLSRCPEASIVDLTHEVPPQSVAEGAFWLERSYRWFPQRTIFVAVVDPGVGTARRALVVHAHDKTFIGPDNGLLVPAICDDDGAVARAIDWPQLGLPEPSRTFHGRDVFAKVAADLGVGKIGFADVGPTVDHLVSGDFPRVGRRTEGVVMTVDHFGNLLTDIEADATSLLDATVKVGPHELPVKNTYGDVTPGECVALVNAFGVVEIAVRDGNAADSLRLGRGAKVVIRVGRAGTVLPS